MCVTILIEKRKKIKKKKRGYQFENERPWNKLEGGNLGEAGRRKEDAQYYNYNQIYNIL